MNKTLIKLTTLAILALPFANFGMNHPMSLEAGLSAFPERKTKAAAAEEADVVMPQAEGAGAGSRQNGKEAKADADAKQAVEQSSFVTVHIPAEIGASTTLSLDEDEVLTLESYKELIEKQKKTGDSFMIARIVSFDPKTRKYSATFRDAHTFNRFLLGAYPLNNISIPNLNLCLPDGKRMLNDVHTPIHDVQYYTYDHQEHAKGFQWLCSYHELFARDQSKNHWLLQFYANQNENLELKKQSIVDLEAMARQAQDGQKLRSLYLLLARQITCPEIQARALASMGDMYYRGNHSVAKDYAKALEAYTKALNNQGLTPLAQVDILESIGNIYHFGGHGIEADDIKALDAYTKVLNHQQLTPEMQVHILSSMGDTYYFGGHGVDQDHAKALDFYTKALNHQLLPPEMQILILENMGDIYFFGDHGVAKDYAKALDACTKALNHQHVTPQMQVNILVLIADIYYLGGHGIDSNLQEAYKYMKEAAQQNVDLTIKSRASELLKEIETELHQSQEHKKENAEQAEQKAASEPKPGDKRKDHPEDPDAERRYPKRQKKE